MQSSQRTVYGAHLQTTQLLGLPLVLQDHTTLNERFQVLETTVLASSDKPSIKYISIGNGGHRMVVGANNISRPEPVLHTPRDAALYNHLPFVLRLPNDDLSMLEVAKYRIRRLEVHGGVTYVAYYLKELDLSNTVPQLELRSVADGITTSTAFIPSGSDLNPTPAPISSNGVIVTAGDYVAATAKVPFVMTPGDIAEFVNACNIIYGDVNYAMISEIALCSGVDKTVDGDFNGATLSYTEAVGVQVNNFITAFFSGAFSNNGITVNLDLGSVEILLNT